MATTTLDQLRAANIRRQAEWPGGEMIDLPFRGLELAGEMGELSNLLKKLVRVKRGISGTAETQHELEAMILDEIGDVGICIDLIGMQTASEITRGGTVGSSRPDDLSSAICEDGNWLASCVGDICGMAYAGGPMDHFLTEAWKALRQLCWTLGIDLMGAIQAKFNRTSRKHELTTMLGEDS